MKFPLKWGIVHFCRLIKTGNIEQNVFFVKTQFLRFCNFFHKKIVKSKLVNFAKMKTQKFMILLQFFINWTTMRVKVYANNWSAKNRDQKIRKIRKCSKKFDMAPILMMFDHLTWIEKSYQETIKHCIFLTNLSHM